VTRFRFEASGLGVAQLSTVTNPIGSISPATAVTFNDTAPTRDAGMPAVPRIS